MAEFVMPATAWRLVIGAALVGWGCNAHAPTAPTGTWLAGGGAERTAQLERHLRGFDVAMLETGYRYVELYWAGRDANWDVAAYQVEKIRLAIENGLERRPKRAVSAQSFLAGPLAATREAIAARAPELFAERFEALTAGCNACHELEKVAFFEVRPPDHRLSPLRREDAAEPR
jgi:hypothetical protein